MLYYDLIQIISVSYFFHGKNDFTEESKNKFSYKYRSKNN